VPPVWGRERTVRGQEPEEQSGITMNFTQFCLIAMLAGCFLHEDRDVKWWLCFAIILTVTAMFVPVSMVGMIVAVGCWKVIKDLAGA
jgi:Flp pilus assembly protein TadB